jgi:ornithine decarboxylase
MLTNPDIIENLIQLEHDGESFYIGNLSQLKLQYDQWIHHLPRVEPFYAIKCNPTPQLVEYLSKFPILGFDCASQGELSLALNLGTPGHKIIFANTSKGIKHLKFAKENGVKMMTFDNESELVKIKKVFPEASLVIRISVEEFGSTLSLKEKFGVSVQDAKTLIGIAKNMNMDVIGVSFHVGSGCKNPEAFYHAIKNCKELFDFAKNELGIIFSLLDLGGGFTDFEEKVTGQMTLFERTTKIINDALDEFFPESLFQDGLRVIAEPGRYFAAKIFTLAVNVWSKKVVGSQGQAFSVNNENMQVEKIMYYLSEGIYSAFNLVIFDHVEVTPNAFVINKKIQVYDQNSENLHKSIIWGATCDGADCVSKQLELPVLEVGDWIIFENFGAYTMGSSSSFNGFSLSKIFWIN